jgi:DNA-binding transcriptional LysR family regulator
VAANRWDLDLKPVAKEPFVLVCHAGAPIAGAKRLSWADLDGLPLIRISAETGNRILIDDALGARRETLAWHYEVERATTALSLVGSGVGYTIVPQLAFEVVHSPALVAIPLRTPGVTRTLGIVTRKDWAPGPQERQLQNLLVQALKARFQDNRIDE